MDSKFLKGAILRSLPCFSLLLLITVLYFPGPLFSDRILLHRDLFFFHYPLRCYWISLLQLGHPPFLNAALNGGQPILSNPNYAVFYPGNLMYLTLPLNLAWNLTLLLHVLWAALGMYLFARSFSALRTAGLAAAVLFACSGPLLSAMSYYNLMIAGSWMPWVLLTFQRSLSERGRWIPLCALAFGAQILAGEPTVEFLTILLMLGSAILSIAKSHTRARDAFTMFLVLFLAASLTAIQWVPTILWLPYSGRSAPLDFSSSAAFWSLHPARLIELFVPNFFGNVMSTQANDFWGMRFSDSGYPYIFRLYCGWLPLLLLPLAVKDRNGRIGLGIFACGLLLAMGRYLPGYHFLFNIFPPLHVVRYPEKFLLLVPFGLSISTAAAITNLSLKTTDNPIRSVIWSGFLLLIIASSFFLLPGDFAGNEHQKFLESVAIRQSIIWAVLTLLTLTLVTLRKSAFTLGLLPLLLLLDFSVVTGDLPQTLSEKEVDTKPFLLSRFPETEEQAIFHDGEAHLDSYFQGGISPEFYLREAIHPLTGLKWGVRYGATNDIDRMSWKLSEARQQWIETHFPKPEAIEEMRRSGIARVISLSVVKSPQLPVERLLKLKENKFIWVYRLSPGPLQTVHWQEGSGEFEWQEESPDHFRIQVKAAGKGTLMVLRNAIPGWKVTLDRVPAEIHSSPQGWILIDVPEEAHTIELLYRPPGLLKGAVITALTSLILFGLFLIA